MWMTRSTRVSQAHPPVLGIFDERRAAAVDAAGHAAGGGGSDAAGAAGRRGAAFVTALAIVVHATVVLALQQMVATPLHYVYESLTSPTNVAGMLRVFDEGTWPARLFGTIDVFGLWWMWLLSVGLAAATGQDGAPIFLAAAGRLCGRGGGRRRGVRGAGLWRSESEDDRVSQEMVLDCARAAGRRRRRGGGVRAARRARASTVTVETIQKRDLEAIVSASGKIDPKKTVNISAQTMGRVTHLAVKEGDRVKAGQFLLQIDPVNAEAAVRRDVAAVAGARTGARAVARRPAERARQSRSGAPGARSASRNCRPPA